jgi:hypothetical protein
MSIIFTPNGYLNIADDPSELKETADSRGINIQSGEMQRCKNLSLDRGGMASTRYGSTKINETAIDPDLWAIMEMGGKRYSFAGQVVYNNEFAIRDQCLSAMWSGVAYKSFNSLNQSIYALNGYDRKRIDGQSVNEWGIEAPTVAPTLSTYSTGLTGAYRVRYTYCRKESSVVVCESNPSPVSASQSLSNQGLVVSFQASIDKQVTHVRIYRTLAGGAIYYFDKDVPIGTTSIVTTTADGSLGTEVATNHDRPPKGVFVGGPTYNGVLFIVYQNKLYFSLPKQPDYWPATYYVEVSQPQFPGQALVFYNGAPYYLTKQKIYYIQGTTATTFYPIPQDSITGCQNVNGAVSVKGKGIYHTGTDGIYLFSGTDKNVTDDAFLPIFHGQTVNDIPAVGNMANSWLRVFRNKIFFGYPGVNDEYPRNIIVSNLDTNRSTYYNYGREIRCLGHDYTNDRLLAGDNEGYIWAIEDREASDDGGTAISWEIESKSFMLQTRRHFPRYVKYDVDASGSDEATGKLTLDGEVHQEHLLTGISRNTRLRHVATGNGNKSSIRITGSGPVTIYATEME